MKSLVRILAVGIFFISAHTALAATITVDTTVPGTMSNGECSLSEAITNANNNTDTSGGDCISGQALPTIDRIEFAISGVGPHTIAVNNQLSITEAVVVDGTTQFGTVCTLEGGIRELKININGAGISFPSNIFNVESIADNVTIKGLAIYGNNDGLGIATWADNTTVQCNNIGTNTAGLVSYPNINGINIYNDGLVETSGHVFGGPNPGDGNLISGNNVTNSGNVFDGAGISGIGNDVLIQGNWIGIDITGQSILANKSSGINFGNGSSALFTFDNVQILDNVVSGNGTTGNLNFSGGIVIGGSEDGGRNELITDLIIKRNIIGLTANGLTAIPNEDDGLFVGASAAGVTIGGIGDGNIISGNGANGLTLGYDISNVQVLGNIIGLNAAGTIARPNNLNGISFTQPNLGGGGTVTNITIGGATPGQGNTVSCNNNDNILIQGNMSVFSIIGNTIGPNSSGQNCDTVLQNYGINLAEITGVTIDANTIKYQETAIIMSATAGASSVKNNTITDNGEALIIVASSTVNPMVSITGNMFTGNSGLGIDLDIDSDDDGNGDNRGDQNVNDASDTDTGPNNYLNHPVILMTMQNGLDTDVLYGLDVPVGYYRVEFFTNPTNGVHASGYGEGEVYKGFSVITKSALGFETFNRTLTSTDLDDNVTATVTECTDVSCTTYVGTSEFSNTAPPGVDYDATDYTASHMLNTVYLGACVNGDNGSSSNTDADGPNQTGAYLGTTPCTDDRDGVEFGSATSGGITPASISAVTLLSEGGDFSGALNDMTVSGTYEGTISLNVLILISSVSPGNSDDADYFLPVFNIGSDYFPGSPTKITPGVPQLLGDGVSIMFENGTGHTVFDNNTQSGPVLTFSLTPESEAFTFTENTGTFLPSAAIAVQVTASANGYVHVWLDANNDGDFIDTGEHKVESTAVFLGENTVSFTGPSQAGTYPIRVRYTSYQDTNLGPTGLANDGEVEDYTITVATPVVVVPAISGGIVHFGKVCNDTRAFNFTNGPGYGDVSVCVYTLQKPSSTNTTITNPGIPFTYKFSRTLRLGMKGEDVRQLQIYLNTHGYPVSTTGAGSLGKETIYFGKATMQALIRFQEAKMAQVLKSLGLTKGTGLFGPATMKVVN
jgi:hypothetical protein